MFRFLLLCVLLTMSTIANARESLMEVPITITAINAGDLEAINAALDLAEVTPGLQQINIVDGPNGQNTTVGSLRGLGSARVILNGMCSPRCRFESPTPAPDSRFLHLHGTAQIQLRRVEVVGYNTSGSGGAILAEDQAELYVTDSIFDSNTADLDGGAIQTFDQAYANVKYTGFSLNLARFFGDNLSINAVPDGLPHAYEGTGNYFFGGDGATATENQRGIMEQHSATQMHDGGTNSTGGVWMINAVYQFEEPSEQQMQRDSKQRLEAQCNDFGTGSFGSAGYNISADNSCALDQPTDLPSTDAMIALSADGIPVPMAGSPAIDSGPVGVITTDGNPLAMLPCGYKDNAGTARPQDANGDGVFECDRGAIEVAGAGEVVAGHSSVFFNPDRNGEGSYVEVLENGRAVVYTFTYNTDGTGPAWFLGAGETSGNSIIIDDLFRPVGASFGDDFDTNDVEFTPAGSMSMVFPDCQAAAPGGNVAYTGQIQLGYEALVTRATRLAHITGCGTETPSANAGLSGSFFDASRNGEGLIVEWLTNGDVLAVFFTYDTQGNQFWVFGQAAANGKSVTMNVIYPTAFTPWGRDFNANDVSLDSWGTFTLTWTDCNTLTFEYSSTVDGFGSGTRNYTRLSRLAGTTCPAFP